MATRKVTISYVQGQVENLQKVIDKNKKDIDSMRDLIQKLLRQIQAFSESNAIIGPQGEAGPPGPQGEQGRQGEKGEKGDTGLVTIIDNISKQYVIPLDGKMLFNVDTKTIELIYNGSVYTVTTTQQTI